LIFIETIDPPLLNNGLSHQGQYINAPFAVGLDNFYDIHQQQQMAAYFYHNKNRADSTSTNHNHQSSVGYINLPQQLLYEIANPMHGGNYYNHQQFAASNFQQINSPRQLVAHLNPPQAFSVETPVGNSDPQHSSTDVLVSSDIFADDYNDCVDDTLYDSDCSDNDEDIDSNGIGKQDSSGYDLKNAVKKSVKCISKTKEPRADGFPRQFTEDDCTYNHDKTHVSGLYAFFKCKHGRKGVINPDEGPCTLRMRVEKVHNERNMFMFAKTIGGKHTCHNRRGVKKAECSPSGIRNVRNEMEEIVTLRATSSDGFQQCARKIATDVLKYVTQEKYKGRLSVTAYKIQYSDVIIQIDERLIVLDIPQMEALVYRVRNRAFGQNWEQYIYYPAIYFADALSPLRPFLRFDYRYANMQANNERKQSRVMGWAHPDNMDLLHKERHAKLFIDGTFKACPEDFGQLMIVMTYAEKYDYYAPIFYILLEDRTETTYSYAINAMRIAVGLDWQVETTTCDFETALIKGIKSNFPDCKIISCLFHFKQALRRWIQANTSISKEGVRRLLGRKIKSEDRIHLKDEYYERGLIELLTVIPFEEVKTFGIPFIRKLMDIEEGKNKKDYESFWAYFAKQWLTKEHNKDWNLADLRNEIHIANRTNNPLERYNRTLNELIKHATKIQMPHLIELLLQDSARVVREIEEKKLNRGRYSEREQARLPEVPEAYEHFKNEGVIQMIGMGPPNTIATPVSSPSANDCETTNQIDVPTEVITRLQTEGKLNAKPNNKRKSKSKTTNNSQPLYHNDVSPVTTEQQMKRQRKPTQKKKQSEEDPKR
jgi:hypothetical protein